MNKKHKKKDSIKMEDIDFFSNSLNSLVLDTNLLNTKKRRFSNIIEPARPKRKKNRRLSFDISDNEIMREFAKSSLLGAITMLLKEKDLDTEEIIKKLTPIYNMIKDNENKNQMKKNIKNCLISCKNFVKEKNKWKINQSLLKINYFENIEKEKKKKKIKKKKN